MTPEQRLDRVERILGLFAREGRRWRVQKREQDEKIDILIHFQMETFEQLNKLGVEFRANLAASHALHDKEMAELRREHKLTHRELQALIRSIRKGRNGSSSG